MRGREGEESIVLLIFVIWHCIAFLVGGWVGAERLV